MKIGIISDLHLFNKIRSIERAASKLSDIDLLLIVGDIADRADEKDSRRIPHTTGKKKQIGI